MCPPPIVVPLHPQDHDLNKDQLTVREVNCLQTNFRFIDFEDKIKKKNVSIFLCKTLTTYLTPGYYDLNTLESEDASTQVLAFLAEWFLRRFL